MSRRRLPFPISFSCILHSPAKPSATPVNLTSKVVAPSLRTHPLPLMEDPSLSSLVAAAGDAYLGSASGSLKTNNGVLSGGGASETDGASGSFKGDGALLSGSAAVDVEFGFQRPEMGQLALVGTVGLYERHVFLCYKSPDVWPSRVEAAEFDRLPRLFSAALGARKADMKKKTLLTICEGEDGTESSNGDVLIFPDMIRYRRLTHFDVETFVEEVLVKDTEWLPGAVEKLTGSYLFICAHGSRDRRCGVCGPVLIKKLKEEINSRGIQDQVFVSPCSHIGGHKYAGNVIIFSPNINGAVTGHWYGYVTPDDVPILLEQHIGKGIIVDHLWRGQMGLSEENQKRAQSLRSQLNGETDKTKKESMQTTGTDVNGTMNVAGGCCQGEGNSSCCQNMPLKGKVENNQIGELEVREIQRKKSDKESKASSTKGTFIGKVFGMPTWFETWERGDTYAVLAVVTAVASVAVAYSCYKQLK